MLVPTVAKFFVGFIFSVAALGVGVIFGRAESLEERVKLLFRPMEAEAMALSPDGQHVAYTRNVRGQLFVVIVNVADPTQRTNVAVAEDRGVNFSREKQPVRIRYLRWATAARLVLAPTEEIVSLPGPQGPKFITPIMAVNADGSDPRTVAEGADFLYGVDLAPPGGEAPQFVSLARHIAIVGFAAGDRENLLVEAIGQAPPRSWLPPIPTTLFKVNLATGKSSIVGEELAEGKLLYDRQGRARVTYAQPRYSHSRPFFYQAPVAMGRWREPGEDGPNRLPKDFLLSVENYFAPRSIPLAFDYDPNVLIYGSNQGRDTWGIYGLNLATRQRTALTIEDPHADLAPMEPHFPESSLVFDESRQKLVGVRVAGAARRTIWLDGELAELQRLLESKLSRRAIEILEWDEARQVLLLRVTAGNEPGRYFIFQRKENVLLEFLRRAPWLPTAELAESRPFEFDSPAGVHLTGDLTLPRSSRLNPPPLLIKLGGEFPPTLQYGFDREAQIFARMGFVVARLNHRGTSGLGARHRDAIQTGIDRVPVADLLAAIDWIAAHQPIDRRRIALVGSGYGGYLALRALQLEPETFRCAVAINAPLDLQYWLRTPVGNMEGPTPVDFPREVRHAFVRGSLGQPAEVSVLRQPEKLTKPLFLIVIPLQNENIGGQNAQLRAALRKLDRAPEYRELTSADFDLGLPAARTRVYRQMEEFFNLNLYDYKVKVGEAKEKK